MVYFCYIDESGTSQVPGNTSHYVLCGISIPVKHWKKCEISINRIKAEYGLSDSEIHTGWINRPYIEQTKLAVGITLASLQNALIRCSLIQQNQSLARTNKRLSRSFLVLNTILLIFPMVMSRHIIETPLYVNSELTGMVQIADLCSFALRRFFENGETDLLGRIKPRFDAHRGAIVGVRHFTDSSCQCEICKSHIKKLFKFQS